MLLGEFAAPEIPAVASLLAAAMLFIAWAVCIGLLIAWRRSIGALLVWLADTIDGYAVNIPHITTIRPLAPLAAALRALESTVDHYLGEAVRWSEKGAVTLFKFFTAINVWMAHEIASLATDTYHGIVGSEERVRAKVQAWAHAVYGVTIHKLTVAVDRLEHLVVTKVEHALTTLRHAAIAVEHDLARVGRKADFLYGRTSKQMARLSRRMSKVEQATVGLGAVALVAAALGRMKLGWLRCPSLLRTGRRLGCGGFDLLEELLALSFVPFILTDACRIVGLIEQLAIKVEPYIADLVLGIEGFVCGGVKGLPTGIVDADLKRVAARQTGL